MGSLRVSAPLREFLIFAQRRGDAERDEDEKIVVGTSAY
jgi:hypothetical protein